MNNNNKNYTLMDAKKAEEAALQAEKDRQKLGDTELVPNSNKSWTSHKVQEKEIYREQDSIF